FPQSSRIYVDGILAGEGKQTIKSPADGKHFLRVVLDGYKTKSQNFKAPGAGKPLSLKIDLEPTEETAAAIESGEQPKKEGMAGAIQRGEFDKSFFSEARKLSNRLKADFIIFGFLTKTEVAYHYGVFVYRTTDGKLVFLEPSVMDLDLANMQIVLLDAESRLMAALANFPEDKVVKGTPPIYMLVPKPVPRKKEVAVKPVEVKEQPKVEEPAPKKDEPAMLPVKEEEPAKKEEPVAVTTGIEELPPDFPMLFEEEEGDYWYKKWWIWTIVGAVVVGGGVGVYYLTAPSSGGGSFSADLEW
ncbi:MAG: hypothetical protein FJ088_12540, partial [Deltaproteobacteria bacterium]|nr:hypothetical protein [Deltaproteobacteria bacterium]